MPDLYDYQIQGKHKVVRNPRMLLAMDCGTGKSAVALSAMERLMEAGKITRPVLVVTLASLKFQWSDEIRKFTASDCVVIDGTPQQRVQQYTSVTHDFPDYVIVNYETLVRDFSWFDEHSWGAVIADEVSALSSHKTKRSKAMFALSQKVNIRVGLTGTPIENGKAEALYNQFQFIDPKVLGSYWSFEKKYIKRNQQGWIVGYRNLPELAQHISPSVYRVRQTDKAVAAVLPDVRDMEPRLVEWDVNGHRLYSAIALDILEVLDEAQAQFGDTWRGFDVRSLYTDTRQYYDPQEMAMKAEIMQRLLALRMVCDHPSLLSYSASLYENGNEGEGSAYAARLLHQNALYSQDVSPKQRAVVEHISDFLSISPEHKVVVFTQYRKMLDILHGVLPGSVTFHGGMSTVTKNVQKKTFETDPDARVFISSDAGGFGLNLQCANLLINYDLPWTFGKTVQRNSRIIRAGSRWPSVTVERFLMKDSVEVRQHEGLQYKTDVAEAILDGGRTDDRGNVESSLRSLRDSLSKFPVFSR